MYPTQLLLPSPNYYFSLNDYCFSLNLFSLSSGLPQIPTSPSIINLPQIPYFSLTIPQYRIEQIGSRSVIYVWSQFCVNGESSRSVRSVMLAELSVPIDWRSLGWIPMLNFYVYWRVGLMLNLIAMLREGFGFWLQCFMWVLTLG